MRAGGGLGTLLLYRINAVAPGAFAVEQRGLMGGRVQQGFITSCPLLPFPPSPTGIPGPTFLPGSIQEALIWLQGPRPTFPPFLPPLPLQLWKDHSVTFVVFKSPWQGRCGGSGASQAFWEEAEGSLGLLKAQTDAIRCLQNSKQDPWKPVDCPM